MEYSQQKSPNADLHLHFSLELIKVPNEKHVNIPLMTAISPFIFFKIGHSAIFTGLITGPFLPNKRLFWYLKKVTILVIV